jgi:hypothetical protein
MNNIIHLQNLFVKLVQADPDLKYYHFGWLSDLDLNIENVFNQEAKAGRQFPCLDWIVPDNISFNIDDPEKETISICLYFSDLQGYDNKGAIDTRTQITVWRDLWKVAKRFLLLLNRGLCELKLGGFDSKGVRYELNAYAGKQRRQDIKFTFNIILDTECIDVESEPLPTLGENCDLEDYCNCIEIP